MAKHVLYDASVTVNSVDLSDHVLKVTYNEGINEVPGAAMGEVQDYSLPGTIKIGDVTVEFFQDFASSKVYATLHPLVTNRTTFNIIVKPTSSSAAATNPQFTLPVFVKNAPFVEGSRGQAHTVTVVFAPAGTQSISAP